MRSWIEQKFPANGSPREKLEFALRYAVLAPLGTNRQSWEYRLVGTHLELAATSNRVIEAMDPDRRESIIGCGAALSCLKLVLRRFGCLGRVALFPDLGDPALVARVHLGLCEEREPGEKLLFEAIAGTYESNPPRPETLVSQAMLDTLSHVAAGERAWLDFAQSETSRQVVLRITPASNRRGARLDPSAARQPSRWPRTLFALGSRNDDSWKVAVTAVPQPSLAAATLAVVKTKTDDEHGWLAAGQTMARTILQARALGLAWAFHDPMPRREARADLRLGVGHKGFAQIILRFGPLAIAPAAVAAGKPFQFIPDRDLT
jgi:nitroreductase